MVEIKIKIMKIFRVISKSDKFIIHVNIACCQQYFKKGVVDDVLPYMGPLDCLCVNLE